MIRDDVLDVMNSGDSWAFVGAGSSVDAGMPSWVSLLGDSKTALAAQLRGTSFDDRTFEHAADKLDLPLAFGILEDAVGRPSLEHALRDSLPKSCQPGPLAKMIADLPFAGYITTNYDGVLEEALSSHGGWVPVGNTRDEVPKVSGDARGLVWHLHGALSLSSNRSSLVLTDRDYDAMYLETSPAIEQLRGLLSHRRAIFLGFSFADQEVIRLLKLVGRLTDVSRPAFAFVPAIGDFKHDIQRAVFLRQHNVDLIPYAVQGDSHRPLIDLLSVYSSLSVRRSIALGSIKVRVPQYDPETTGLLIYNELVGRHELDPTVNRLRESLMDSRILALLTDVPRSLDSLSEDVIDFARALGQRVAGVLTSDDARDLVAARCEALEGQGFVAVSESVSLTAVGREKFRSSVAQSELMRDQFRASLLARARSQISGAQAQAQVIADAAAAFLDECIKRRSLGVAMALAVDRSDQQSYHMVALLQGLRTQLSAMQDLEHARVLIAVVQEALADPSTEEAKYVGTALQAGFGVHLLGFNQDTIQVRLRDLSTTAFVLDATTLIPALARGSQGHEASMELLRQLSDRGCTAVTTTFLVEEAAEHARWAQRKVAEGGSWQSAAVLEALLGASGSRSNDFLHGFVESLDAGSTAGDFNEFLAMCFGGMPVRGEVTNAHVAEGLSAAGVTVVGRLDQVEGYESQDKLTLDTYQTAIKERRQANSTLTHTRQVSAEAEALVLVEGIRAGSMHVADGPMSGAFFVSHSQFLNDVTHSSIPPVLRQEAALQWLLALSGHGPEASAVVYDGLLWELQERRADLVDKALLRRVFKPTIDAAKQDLEGELERYRHTVASGSGVLWEDIDDLQAPRVLASAETQTTRELAAKLAEAEARVYNLERELDTRSAEDTRARAQKKAKGAARYQRQQDRRQGRGRH